jgi:hypothetical protein
MQYVISLVLAKGKTIHSSPVRALSKRKHISLGDRWTVYAPTAVSMPMVLSLTGGASPAEHCR